MGVTDHRHYDLENKIENKVDSLHLQECSLKNRSSWKLVMSLEASFFDVTFLYTVSGRYKRDYLHASIDILLNIMFVCTYETKKVPI